MVSIKKIAAVVFFGCAAMSAQAAGTKAEVIHWWTSGGESAAIKELANAYNAAGGEWVDSAVAGGEQARSTAINRMVGNNAPTAAQFNTSKQFFDLIEGDMLNNVDDVAAKGNWDTVLPTPIINTIKYKGHYFAVPVNIHNPAWIWYSKAAFAKAGVTSEPKTMDELFAALDKVKAAGLVPLALGGQAWQEKMMFDAIFAYVGGADLFLKVYRDRDVNAINTPEFKKVLTTFKRLHDYVDAGSPGRDWNVATGMLISGKAGVQIMGDWAKGEFLAANQTAGKEFGCFAGFGPKAPYVVAGDVFIMPKSSNPEVIKAQQLLATVMVAPATQVAFNNKKGSIPIRTDVDASKMDICAQQGIAAMKDKSRQLPTSTMLVPTDVEGAMQDVVTNFWNKGQSVEEAAKALAAALKK
jgi:glucose/mannose transport system substrate-binding protein